MPPQQRPEDFTPANVVAPARLDRLYRSTFRLGVFAQRRATGASLPQLPRVRTVLIQEKP